MINPKIYWRVWIVIGIFIFLVISILKGNLEFNIRLIPSIISSASISLLLEAIIFKKWIWKCCPNLFYPWLCKIPYIGGEWEGELKSDYIYPETNKKGEPILAKMKILHEFDEIKVTLVTGKSNSNSFISNVWIDGGNRKFICYTYSNTADENRDTNPNHDGTAKLRINDDDKKVLILEGHYFTGRKTTGKMVFKRISK